MTDEKITFYLQYSHDYDAPGSHAYPLGKPYITTSPQVTIRHLKRYIYSKCGFAEKDERITPVQIRCRKQHLDDRQTARQICDKIWKDPAADMTLTFYCSRPQREHRQTPRRYDPEEDGANDDTRRKRCKRET